MKRRSIGAVFTEGGKPENPEKNPRSTGETNNKNNSAHTNSKFFGESTRGYTQVVTHPAITPSLNFEFSGEKQRANRIRHSSFKQVKVD